MVRRQPISNLLSRTAGRCSRHFSLFLHRIAPKAHMHFPTHLRATKPSLHCQLDSQFRTAGATGSFKCTGGESLGFSCQQQDRKWHLVKSHGAKRGQSGGSRRDRRGRSQRGLQQLGGFGSVCKSQNRREAPDTPVPFLGTGGPAERTRAQPTPYVSPATSTALARQESRLNVTPHSKARPESRGEDARLF